MQHINKTAMLLVGTKGGEITAINPDGVVAWSVGLTQGIHKAATYVAMLGAGDSLRTSGSVTVKARQDRLKRQDFGDLATESGANPDFTVTSADRMARELQRKLNGIDQTSRKLERRLATLDAIEKRAPKKGRDDASAVIDEGDLPDEAEAPEIVPAVPEKEEKTKPPKPSKRRLKKWHLAAKIAGCISCKQAPPL